MKPFSRLITTITSQFDEMVSQIENHEAIAEASLRNLREDIRNAKVQYKMVQKDLQQTTDQRQSTEQEIVLWKQRACKYGETDREKALHCMRRIQQHQREVDTLNHKESELSEVNDRLKQQLLKVENQYQVLRARIQSMACRDHAANLVTTPKGVSSENMEDIFSRWDRSITKKEVSCDIMTGSIDEIETTLAAEEEIQDLEMALDEVLKSKKPEAPKS